VSFSSTEKLAACISIIFEIPHEHQKLMTADQVCSLVEWDHWPIRRADGGPDRHWNARPRLIAVHRHKTAKIDAPDMARERKVRRADASHKARLIAKGSPELERALDALLSRRSRLRSRGFDRTKTRTFRGAVVPRKQRRRT
jgi:hypothetical protein